VQNQNISKAPNGREFLEHLNVQFCGCKPITCRRLDGNTFPRSSFFLASFLTKALPIAQGFSNRGRCGNVLHAKAHDGFGLN
jgi:hypothetical protein